jgi:hypothetical protein
VADALAGLLVLAAVTAWRAIRMPPAEHLRTN